MSQTLVIASLSSIQAPSSPFPSLLSSQSPSPEHHLFDRFILPSVTPIASASITKIHVVLTDKDLTGFKFGELESIVKRSWSVLKEGGELEWTTLGQVAEIKDSLEKGGFKITEANNNVVKAVSLPPPTTSVPLKLRKKKTETNGAVSLWSISPSSFNQSEQLIDEDSLLSAEDLERPKLVAREECDPDVKKRKKRCKNCTCGLKDMVLEEDDDLPENLKGGGKQQVNGKAITSSCGSCYLGDAFRCSSCPYLGLPPFKPGEKVEIPLGSDDLDI